MNFGGMNPLAIALAALAAFGFGLAYRRFVAPGRPQGAGRLAATLVAYGLAAWVLAGTLGHLGVGQVTLRNGLISAGFVWAGFVLPALLVSLPANALSPRATALEAAGWLAAVLVMGAVIGGIGV